VALFEQDGTAHNGTMFFYLTEDDRTEQLHLESGLTNGADGWGIGVNSDCTVKVLWSGYRQ
jgi:hypothetical protein